MGLGMGYRSHLEAGNKAGTMAMPPQRADMEDVGCSGQRKPRLQAQLATESQGTRAPAEFYICSKTAAEKPGREDMAVHRETGKAWERDLWHSKPRGTGHRSNEDLEMWMAGS